jgi:hypothetical protein
VVDLLAETSRAALGVAMGDLLTPWQEIAFVRGEQPPTWALALRLQKVGCAGARVLSAVLSNAASIVLWRWNDGPNPSRGRP